MTTQKNDGLLIVCGTFNNEEGKPSKIGLTIAKQLFLSNLKKYPNCLINGGNIQQLKSINFSEFSIILWMPNIDNSEDKILPEIKKQNPHAILISSKRVIEKEYTEWDVVGRLLASRANLGIMITKNENSHLNFQILDPLGNSYYNGNDADELGGALANRLNYMLTLTRMSSISLEKPNKSTIQPEFIEVVKNTAEEFSKHVNANNPNRMLGNASTRCMLGFPAVRKKTGSIFVTRRNIDKKTIAPEGFIECQLSKDGKVEYYGNVKPSVDTPIQLMLFDKYPEVKYIIHGHVYVVGAHFTRHKIPCGYIEEFKDVVQTIEKWFPRQQKGNFDINLYGHGCLILAKDIAFFDDIEYCNRELPENDWLNT